MHENWGNPFFCLMDKKMISPLIEWRIGKCLSLCTIFFKTSKYNLKVMLFHAVVLFYFWDNINYFFLVCLNCVLGALNLNHVCLAREYFRLLIINNTSLPNTTISHEQCTIEKNKIVIVPVPVTRCIWFFIDKGSKTLRCPNLKLKIKTFAEVVSLVTEQIDTVLPYA